MAESPPLQRNALPAAMAPGVIDRNRSLLQEAQRETYKTVNGHALDAYIFRPQDKPTASRSAILFFFSGGWDSGLISQFAPHCLHFAHRGMVAALIDYRVSSRHGATPLDAMADAKSAMRWLRMNAETLNIAPDKIVGAGGAAGAHIILSAAMIPGFDDPEDDAAISPEPNALLLFNPILDTTRKGAELEKFPDKKTAKACSPMHCVRRKLPPMLVFHGTQDRVVPVDASRKFVSKMRWRRNPCRLSVYEGQGHGFFNFNVDATMYERTINEADAFLVERGFLEPNEDDDGESRLT